MRRVLFAGGLACILALGVGIRREMLREADSRPFARQGLRVADLPPYGDELRKLPQYGNYHPPEDGPDAPGYLGPGWDPRRSPDGKLVAVTVSWETPVARLLGLVWGRPWYHNVTVVEEGTGRTMPVVSIREPEPGSGPGHHYSWSTDSNALLIRGQGGLFENYNDVVSLCLVYLPRTNELFRLTNCPPVL